MKTENSYYKWKPSQAYHKIDIDKHMRTNMKLQSNAREEILEVLRMVFGSKFYTVQRYMYLATTWCTHQAK